MYECLEGTAPAIDTKQSSAEFSRGRSDGKRAPYIHQLHYNCKTKASFVLNVMSFHQL